MRKISNRPLFFPLFKDNHLINPILLIRESCLDLIRKGLLTRTGFQLKRPRVSINRINGTNDLFSIVPDENFLLLGSSAHLTRVEKGREI